jgi:hypothetical protein
MDTVMINYSNGHEMIMDGKITGYRTIYLFIPLGKEFPDTSSKNTAEFEFSDGTIWEGRIDLKGNEVHWHYGKNGELLGIKQKVTIDYTVKHESKEAKKNRFKIYQQ